MDTIKLHAQCLLISHAMSNIRRDIRRDIARSKDGVVYLDRLDDIIDGLHSVAQKIEGVWRTGSDNLDPIQPWLGDTLRRIRGLTGELYEYSMPRGDAYEPIFMCAWYMLGELLDCLS